MFTNIQFIELDTIDSTNAEAKRIHHDPHRNTLIAIIARDQKQGRGRYEKNWISTKDQSILMTFLFSLPPSIALHQFTQVLAYSTARFFHELGCPLQIKWPNDLFCSDKKIGGILLESHLDKIVLGIGINCNEDQHTLSKIDQKATTFQIETGNPLYVLEAAKTLARLFLGHLNQRIAHGFTPFQEQINEHFFISRRALWSDGNKKIEGQVIGLDPSGLLILETSDQTYTLSNGSLQWLEKE